MNQAELIGKVIEISHSNLDLTARVNAILNIISQDLGFEDVMVYTFDKDKRLTCRYSNQKSMLFGILSHYRCHIGEGIIGSVAQRRAPEFFTIKDISPRFGCLFYPELDDHLDKFRTFSFLPLSDDSYLFGVIVLCSYSHDYLQDQEKVLLSVISRELGGILRSFELILSSKKRINELAMLSELGRILTSNVEPQELLKSIALIIAKSLSASFVSVKLEYPLLKLDTQRFTYGIIDPQAQEFVDQLEKSAIELLRPASMRNGTQEQFDRPPGYSLYSAPILSKNRVLGTITLCGDNTEQQAGIEENGQYVINTIANYISSGLENTLLNSRLRNVVRELTDAQKRLIEQEKFRSLGEMTANIAHEIKNPLVIIGGFTKRLAKKMQNDHTENRYINIILNEVGRLETILNEILHYVKESQPFEESCKLQEFLEDVLYILSSDPAWESVKIIRDFDEQLEPVSCDSQQLKQVFINLLMNAFEAMRGTGTISVKVRKVMHGGQPFAAASITDTGGGIDPAIIDNIFNPFFTTKERGTGLGLAISNKIVTNHKGHIEVENVAGKGVTFILYLPMKNITLQEELT
ncbi:MAG: sensor signal transduction histidine kinase [Deltaproteobacteria bacterium]|nr:sensor signal transduction histidine kinase [Deltaproteobacteria bacterium]